MWVEGTTWDSILGAYPWRRMVLISQQTLTVGVHLGLGSCQISLVHNGMLTDEVICKFCLNNQVAKITWVQLKQKERVGIM